MQMFETGPERYSPGINAAYGTVNQRNLARLVGYVALLLPFALLVSSHVPGFRTCFRDSISHYYYAQFWGGPFVGSLVFIGAFLWVYQGEDANGAERKLATWAGSFAIGVALFPTSGWGCEDPSFAARAMVMFGGDPLQLLKTGDTGGIEQHFQLFPYAATLHYFSALGLFSFLTWFALFVFTSVEPHQRTADGRLTQKKIIRNVLYYCCGAVMILCMMGMGLYAMLDKYTTWDMSWWNDGEWTFWCEAVALWAFGLSWMVKGRFWSKLQDQADSTA